MKPKVAFYWCAACGGCEEAVVDLAEQILDAVAAVDIVFWPVALDFKRKDIAAMADGSIAAAFINGAVRTSEQREMAHLLRKKSQAVVAFGACAQLGGIPGLANFWDRAAIFSEVYREETPPAQGLPELFDTVLPLGGAIDVDYFVPGCPPTPKLITDAVMALVSGRLPPKGEVLAPDRALCDECPRKDAKPEKLAITEFRRPHEVLIEQNKCIMAQGLVCLGPATRGGCGARCIAGNMPCTGCFGPTSRVRDFGGKALSAVASLVGSNDEAEIARILEKIPDPAGTFYRYSLPASLLGRRRIEHV